MTATIAVDPGIVRCGVVAIRDRAIIFATVCSPDDLRDLVRGLADNHPDARLVIERSEDGYIPPTRCRQVSELKRLEGRIEAWHPAAEWRHRKDVLAALRIPAVRGAGQTDKAVRAELDRLFGVSLFARGKLCPKRKQKRHSGACPICNGSGHERKPGPLAGLGADGADALALAVSVAGESGIAPFTVDGTVPRRVGSCPHGRPTSDDCDDCDRLDFLAFNAAFDAAVQDLRRRCLAFDAERDGGLK